MNAPVSNSSVVTWICISAIAFLAVANGLQYSDRQKVDDDNSALRHNNDLLSAAVVSLEDALKECQAKRDAEASPFPAP